MTTEGVAGVLRHVWAGHRPTSTGRPLATLHQRTMEVLRDLGVEDAALQQGTLPDLMGDTVLCTSLAGEEIGRIRS